MSEPEAVIEFGDDRLDATQRAVRSAAFRHLVDTGQRAHIATIAENTPIPQHTVGEVLQGMAQRGTVQFDNDGRVLGIAGLSVTPTRHTIIVAQGERWTWCALDAIGIVGALGSGTITSQTPEGDVILSLDKGVFHPKGWAIFIADGYGVTSSIGQWCPLVDFFPDEASADRWAEQNDVLGRGVPITRLAPMAADRWRAIIEDT